MTELRELAGRAWRTGRYHAGVALDRAADLLDEAEKSSARRRLRGFWAGHRHTRIGATAHLDQLRTHVRDFTRPGALVRNARPTAK